MHSSPTGSQDLLQLSMADTALLLPGKKMNLCLRFGNRLKKKEVHLLSHCCDFRSAWALDFTNCLKTTLHFSSLLSYGIFLSLPLFSDLSSILPDPPLPAATSPQAVVSSCMLSKIGLDDRCWKKPEFSRRQHWEPVSFVCTLWHRLFRFSCCCEVWGIAWGTRDFAQMLPISIVFTVNLALFYLFCFSALEILEEQGATR